MDRRDFLAWLVAFFVAIKTVRALPAAGSSSSGFNPWPQHMFSFLKEDARGRAWLQVRRTDVYPELWTTIAEVKTIEGRRKWQRISMDLGELPEDSVIGFGRVFAARAVLTYRFVGDGFSAQFTAYLTELNLQPEFHHRDNVVWPGISRSEMSIKATVGFEVVHEAFQYEIHSTRLEPTDVYAVLINDRPRGGLRLNK